MQSNNNEISFMSELSIREMNGFGDGVWPRELDEYGKKVYREKMMNSWAEKKYEIRGEELEVRYAMWTDTLKRASDEAFPWELSTALMDVDSAQMKNQHEQDSQNDAGECVSSGDEQFTLESALQKEMYRMEFVSRENH